VCPAFTPAKRVLGYARINDGNDIRNPRFSVLEMYRLTSFDLLHNLEVISKSKSQLGSIRTVFCCKRGEIVIAKVGVVGLQYHGNHR
jgi:hypothetical protein